MRMNKLLNLQSMIKILRNLSYLYIGMVVLSFLISWIAHFPSFEQVGHLQNGCYWTDALVPYIECRGLFANGFIKFFLNYLMQMIYMVMFSVYLVALPIAILMWSPVGYLIWYHIKGKNLTSQASGTP